MKPFICPGNRCFALFFMAEIQCEVTIGVPHFSHLSTAANLPV